MISIDKVNDAIRNHREIRDKNNQGVAEQQEHVEQFENNMDKLKKYLLNAQSLLQKTIDTVDSNTQAASLSNHSCDEIVNYAIRTESLYPTPTEFEVHNSYLVKLSSRGNQKVKIPKLYVSGKNVEDLDRIQHIQIGRQGGYPNSNVLIQPCQTQGNAAVTVTEDKQMPNICIHQTRESFEQFFQKSKDSRQDQIELRFLSSKIGMMESELAVVVIDLKNSMNQQQNVDMVPESINLDSVGSQYDYGS